MPQVPDRDQSSGNFYTPWVAGSCTESPICKAIGPKGPGLRDRWQGGGQRDNKWQSRHSGNPGFHLLPRFRKTRVPSGLDTRFQEHKGFRKSPSQSWVLCGPSLNSEFMFVCSVGAQRRSTDLFWCCCKIFCLNCSDVASTKAHATSSN